jgi:Protein of unknown function (DUF2567)
VDETPRRTAARHPELWAALVVAGVVAASGIPLGLVWAAVAPKVPFVMTSSGASLTDPYPEQFAADAGWFAFVGLAVGIVAAAVVWVRARRYRGPLTLAALTLGALAAGLLGAWLGSRFGQGDYGRLFAHAAPGTRFTRPADVRTEPFGSGWLELRPWAFVHALAAAVVYTLLAAFHMSPDLDAEPVSSDLTEPPAQPAELAPPEPDPAAPPPG